MTRHHGFTLAEVLITLGIIGVVAAITMPVLIQNYQKKATATSVKKAYSILNQVIESAKADYGDPSGWDYYEESELTKWVQTYIEPYLQVVSSGTCSRSSNNKCQGLSYIHRLDTDISLNNRNAMMPQYLIVTGGEPIGYAFFRQAPYLSQTTVLVYVKNPKTYAQIGKNVFSFHFDKSTENPRFMPRYMNQKREDLLSSGTMGGNSCNRQSGSGYACTTVIMLDGWEIKDGYPW